MILRHKAVLELLRSLGHDPDEVLEVRIDQARIEVISETKDGYEEIDYHE